MNAPNKILFAVLAALVCAILIAANSQDDSRTYFTAKAFSANEIGNGPTSVADEDLAFNKMGTGVVYLEFPVDSITGSVYADDYIWFELGGLATTSGEGAVSVVGGDGITVTGSGTAADPFQVTVNASDLTGTGVGEFENGFIFVPAEIGTATWGSGSGITWTFDASGGTDPTVAFGDDIVTFATANLGADGSLFVQEKADAIADIADWGQIWVNTASPNELWFTDDAGTDFRLGLVDPTRANYEFPHEGNLTPGVAVALRNDNYACIGYGGTITKASSTVIGWVDDTFTITVFYGTIGALSSFNWAIDAVQDVHTPGSPPAVSAGDVIYVSVLQDFLGDDPLSDPDVNVYVTE